MKRLILGLALIALTITLAARARAQVDVGYRSFGIFQDRALVGEIYRIDADPEKYVEHWVLYPQYVYPSERNGAAIEIRPGLNAYDSLDDFFRRVPFDKGSRYVKVDCLDGASLPGR